MDLSEKLAGMDKATDIVYSITIQILICRVLAMSVSSIFKIFPCHCVHIVLHRHKYTCTNTITSPTSTASSVKVATVNTTPKRPSIAKVIAWASLATKTAALDASLSKLHSIPDNSENCYFVLGGY